MIYRDTKHSKTKPQELRGTLKPRHLNKSEKQNKDKSKSGNKNDLTGVLKRHNETDRHKFNMTAELKKDEKKGLLITGDVSALLKNFGGGKNKNETANVKSKREIEMTEDDVNKLFGESPRGLPVQLLKEKVNQRIEQMGIGLGRDKEKEREKGSSSGVTKKSFANTDTRLDCLKTRTMKLQIKELLGIGKDFADSIKFLYQDDDDKMLAALDQGDFEAIQPDSQIDKTAKFKEEFVIGKQVGEGAYASVRVAIWTTLNKKVAIKIYEKRKINEAQRRRSVRREIKILQRINHNNILKVYDALQTNNHVNIIMQYISGVSLGSLLKSQPGGKFSQKDAKFIIARIIDAVKYLHEQNVCHRDIKLDNILVDSKLQPKLIDFGFATCLDKTKKIKMFCGTPSFMAPEIVSKSEYRGEPADIWALGVVLFVMVAGYFPFKGQTDKELYQKICTSDYNRIQHASRGLTDLLACMLTVDADKRITAEEILQHDWINNIEREKEIVRTTSRSGSYEMGNLGVSLNLSKRTTEEKERKFTETYKHADLKEVIKKAVTKPASCTNKTALSFKFPTEEKRHTEVRSPNVRQPERLTNKAYL